jgi:hypothetical protein
VTLKCGKNVLPATTAQGTGIDQLYPVAVLKAEADARRNANAKAFILCEQEECPPDTGCTIKACGILQTGSYTTSFVTFNQPFPFLSFGLTVYVVTATLPFEPVIQCLIP